MDPQRRKAIQHAILRLADGDRTAMPLLVDQLWPVLLSYAEHGLRDAQVAEDVAQEVLFRISSRISELDRSRDPLSWAFGIATFEIMTQRKRRLRSRDARGRNARFFGIGSVRRRRRYSGRGSRRAYRGHRTVVRRRCGAAWPARTGPSGARIARHAQASATSARSPTYDLEEHLWPILRR